VRACPNCGTRVSDRFCPGCGQRNAERIVSVRRMLREQVEDQLSLEGRLPRTLATLVRRPGALTSEYAAGRIARYVPPLRLYLAASLLFFFTLSLVADFGRVWRALGPQIEAATRPGPDGRPRGDFVIVRTGIDSAAAPAWLKPLARHYVRQEAEINAMEPREGVRVLYGALIGNVPAVVFALVPLFALLLKGLYRRRMYVEHFVFLLHFHALAMLLATATLVVRSRWAVAAAAVWLAVHLFLAQRRVYGESRLRTAAKFVPLLLAYVLSLTLVVAAVMVVTILTV
jgi:hypothetical protein